MSRARTGNGWRSRRVLLVVMAVLVLAGGGVALALNRGTASAQVQPRTVTVSHGTVQQTVSASGTIEPAVEDDLSFRSAGTVDTVGVDVGQHVTRGEVLASIDTTSLQSQVTLARAVVTQAQAQVSAAGSSGSASQIAAADAQLASAQARLVAARESLAEARLTSPIDGVVAALNVKVGSTVGGSGGSGSSGSSGSASGSGPSASGGGSGSGGTSGSGGASSASGSPPSSAAVSVISTNGWVVQTQVANADLASLKKGLQAQILPSGSRTTIFGTVQAIGIVASSSSSGTSQFPVTVAVTGTPTGLYAGTAATVSIVVKQVDNVLTVPTVALSSSGGRTTVDVLQSGQQVTTAVTIGRIFGARTEITGGLADGAQVVLPSSFGTRGTGTGTGSRTGGFGGGGGRRSAPAGSAAAGSAAAGSAAARGTEAETWQSCPSTRMTSSTVLPCRRSALARRPSGADRRRSSISSTSARPIAAVLLPSRPFGASTSRSRTGEFVAIIGPSGSGKSTLMHILGCLDVPTTRLLPAGRRGRQRHGGTPAGRHPQPADRLRVPAVQPPAGHAARGATWSCRSCMPACRGRTPGAGPGGARRGGLADRVDHRPGELSGGQQQRVAVARRPRHRARA